MAKSTKEVTSGQGESHAAGSEIFILQTLVHNPVGAIGYDWPNHWVLHFTIADAAYDRLSELHATVAAIESAENKVRLVADSDLITRIYDSGTSMVSNLTRSVTHLAQQMSDQTQKPLTAQRTIDRIREATGNAGIDCRTGHSGYHGIGEIIRVRDAVEHPSAETLYRMDTDWDRVPLAWLFSDLSLKAYRGAREWLQLIAKDWNAWQEHRSGPTTLTVERGVYSRVPSKKPPGQKAS
jgi:hypothetical protein